MDVDQVVSHGEETAETSNLFGVPLATQISRCNMLYVIKEFFNITKRNGIIKWKYKIPA